MSPKIAIIGAGMAGLSAAQHLEGHAQLSIFDKSRGVGGRMSTRYAGEYEFDHGAQFFTAPDPDFAAFITKAEQAGAAARWEGRALYLKDGARVPDTGRARWVGTPRMNSLPKYMAQDLPASLGCRVRHIARDGDNWILHFEDETLEGGFDGVICTAPPAQAKDILPADFAQMDSVRSAKMNACFALMIGLSERPDLDWETLRISDGPVSWLAVNSAKPGRADSPATLVIHSAPDWSETHQDAGRDWVQAEMVSAAQTASGLDLAGAPHAVLHRWLYASNDKGPDAPCLTDPRGIAACGDWCLGGRVEGAWISGRAAAENLRAALAI